MRPGVLPRHGGEGLLIIAPIVEETTQHELLLLQRLHARCGLDQFPAQRRGLRLQGVALRLGGIDGGLAARKIALQPLELIRRGGQMCRVVRPHRTVQIGQDLDARWRRRRDMRYVLSCVRMGMRMHRLLCRDEKARAEQRGADGKTMSPDAQAVLSAFTGSTSE